MTYRDTLLRLADGSQAAVEALWNQLDLGDIGPEEFTALTVTTIERSKRRAVTLADLSLAAALTVQLRRPIAPIGLELDADTDRLRLAVGTVVALGTIGRAGRLARAEPLTAAASAYSRGIAASPDVIGWRRQTHPGACEVCAGLATGVLPPQVPMHTHPGCSCVPIPVTQ